MRCDAPKPGSEQTNLERPYWFEADRLFQLFDEAIKNYWKIADETEDFLKGFGYRLPKAEPPELADTLAYFCHQAEQRGVKRGLEVAKEAVLKDCDSHGKAFDCYHKRCVAAIQSEITKLNL
jgi:DNA polymerase III alpha subunit